MRTLAILSCAAAMGLAAGVVPAVADGELHLYNWSNYFSPKLIEKFAKETGTKVSIDAYASEEDLLAKLQAGGGGYDVIFPGPTTLKAMIEKNLIADIKVNEMSNYKNVAAPFRSVSGDEKRTYSAPYMWGTTGFTYIPSMVPGGKLEESWKEVFEPREELKGKIGMLNEKSDVYNAAAYYLGVDKCTEDAAEAQKILDLLLKQKPAVKVYSNDGTIDRTAAGEVAMHMQWNGASHKVKKTKAEAVYVYPKEGVTFWTDTMAVPASAPNMDNAKAFINWMLLPENAAEASNFTGYMNAIDGSGKFMDKGLEADPAVNTPSEFNSRLSAFKQCSPKALEMRDKVWTKLKS